MVYKTVSQYLMNINLRLSHYNYSNQISEKGLNI